MRTLTLDNGLIRADVLPELGGKVWSLRRPGGREWIWRNPGVPPRPVGAGAAYDDNWAGGWEELFPNDAAGSFDGRELPDHGEWWSSSWTVREPSGSTEAELALECRSVPASCVKRLSLEPGSARLRVSYVIANRGDAPLRFLFKQHLALAVTPDCLIELPGGDVTAVDLGFSTRLGRAGPFRWPVGGGRGGGEVDLSRLPGPQEKQREFVYVDRPPEGWCGAFDAARGERLRLSFDTAVFPCTWLFMDLGGWRGLYTAVLEPCTNMPKDLAAAAAAGRCATLAPGSRLECEVVAELS